MVAKVTARDVARYAGVSQPSVSRVFSNDKSVSQALSEKVHKAAKELGYQPNLLARSLNTGRSNMIGCIMPRLDDPVQALILHHILKTLETRGFRCLLETAQKRSANALITELKSQGVDGVLLCCSEPEPFVTDALPMVLVGESQNGVASVSSDHFQAAYWLAQHFVDSGHQRIAHISMCQRLGSSRSRIAGFAAGLEARGCFAMAVFDAHGCEKRAEAGVHALFEQQNPPDALFVDNDALSAMILRILQDDLQLNIPSDVALIGYGDTPFARAGMCEISNVRLPVELIARTAATHLLDLIEGTAKAPQSIELESQLLLRQTTRNSSDLISRLHKRQEQIAMA